MKIKLIASDLDGTLLTNDKKISLFTRETMEAAIAGGIHFVLATGRAYRSVPEELRKFPGIDYIITSNGAAIYSVSGKKRIYQCLLDEKSVDRILSLPLSSEIALEGFIEGVPYGDERYVNRPEAFGATDQGALYVKNTRNKVADMRQFLGENKNRLDSISFVCSSPVIREDLRRTLKREVPDIYVTSSVDHLVEIGHKNAGKGKTLQVLLNHLGITQEEAMAFGDAENDLDMLTAVSKGIAMGNGAEICKQAAFFVTDTNEEDGVAKAVRKFVTLENEIGGSRE